MQPWHPDRQDKDGKRKYEEYFHGNLRRITSIASASSTTITAVSLTSQEVQREGTSDNTEIMNAKQCECYQKQLNFLRATDDSSESETI